VRRKVMSDDAVEREMLSEKHFGGANLKNFNMAEGDVEIPELNVLLGVESGKVATVRVRQLELDEFLKIQGDNVDYIRNVLDGIIESSYSKKAVQTNVDQVIEEMGGRTRQLIDTIEVGLIEPKLNRAAIIKMSRMFPMAAWKIFNHINFLTSKGADLKKNSS
jgi:hypothetical protein